MSKRILSLVLALAMLILALPVFALPALGADTPNPTVNFVKGADPYTRKTEAIEGTTNVKATYQNYGTPIASSSWKSLRLPTAAELAAVGLAEADILTWAFWDSAASRFWDIADYMNGFCEIPDVDVIDLYPIYKESTLWGQGNMPSFTVVRTNVSEGNDTYVAAGSATFSAFRGGYSLHEWDRAQNKPYAYYSVVDQHYLTSYYDRLWSYGGYYMHEGQFVASPSSAWTNAIDYQVMADASLTVTVPKSDKIAYMVLLNDDVVLGGTAAGNSVFSATAQDAANWGRFSESDESHSVTLVAEKDDLIRIVFYSTTGAGVNIGRFSPSVTYNSFESVYRSSFLENRPTTIGGNIGDGSVGKSEPVAFRGNWDYISYGSLTLANPSPLDVRYTWSKNEEAYLQAGVTDITKGNGFINANTESEDGAWPAYAIGVYKDKVVGTRYTAPKSGKIDISAERILMKSLNADSTLVLGYAVYVDGKKVWPATGDWYEVTYYGANVTDKTAAVKAAPNTDLSADINPSLPTDIDVQKGDTVEFLVAGISHYNPVNVKDDPYYWNHYIAKAAYFDGRVTYTKMAEAPSILVTPSIGDTLDLAFSLSDESAGTGVEINGVPARLITVAPENADQEITVRSYISFSDAKTVYGEEIKTTFNSILEKYLGDPTYGEKAEAALAYTRAFAAYFANGTVAEAEEPAGDYAARAADSYIKAASCPGGATVGFRGVSLLLNEKVGIKVVVNSTDTRYALEVADNSKFTGADTIAAEPTDDKSGIKFIMDGISALRWDTDYYFRIVDTANGNRVVSDTLRYGVSVYHARMCADPNVTANIKNLSKTMMCLYEKLNGGYISGIGDRIPFGATVLTPTVYSTAGATVKSPTEIAAMLASGSLAAGVYTVSGTEPVMLSSLAGKNCAGGGAVILSPAGFVINGCTDTTLSGLTLVGPVSVTASTGLTLADLQIHAGTGLGLSVDAASARIYVKRCRIEGKTAVENAADDCYLLESYIGYTAVGLSDLSAKNLYVRDCRFIGKTGAAILTASDEAEIRKCTMESEGADAIVSIGAAENVLLAECVIRGATNALLVSGAENTVVLRNSLGAATVKNGKHLYVCDNVFGDILSVSDNEYLLADGNKFTAGKTEECVDAIGNTNTNGDSLMDVTARLSAGADDSLLPHVDRDQFFDKPRKKLVRDPDGDMELSEYVLRHAASGDHVIVAPGAYVMYENFNFVSSHSNTTVYAYGMFAERPAGDYLAGEHETPKDHGGDPLHGLIYTKGVENLSLKGGTYGYEFQGISQGHIIDILEDASGNRTGEVVLRASPGFVKDIGLSDPSVFSATTYGFRNGNGWNYADLSQSSAVLREDGTVLMTLAASEANMLRVGDVITNRPSVGTYAVETERSLNILYQDMTVFGAASGVCFHESYNLSSITYYRVADPYRSGMKISAEEYNTYLAEEAAIRAKGYTDFTYEMWEDKEHGCYRGPDSRNASLDGVHVVASAGGAQIISSLFERLGDDGTNELGSYARLSSIHKITEDTFEIVYKGNLSEYWNQYAESDPTNYSRRHAHVFTQDFKPGDEIIIYTANGGLVLEGYALEATDKTSYRVTNDIWESDMPEAYQYIETRRVKIKVTNFDEDVLADYEAYLDAYTADDNAIVSSQYNGGVGVEQYKVFVHNNSMASNGVHIDNTKVTCGRARAALIKSSHVVIENCTYEHIGMAAIGVYYETQWGESAVSRDVVIRNNVINHTGYRTNHIDPAPIAVLAPRMPAPGVDNNNPDLDKISLYTDVTISGNIFRNRAVRKEWSYNEDEYAISCVGVRNLVITNNDLAPARDMLGDPALPEDAGLCTDLTKTIRLVRINGCTIEGNIYPANYNIKQSFSFSHIQGLRGADVMDAEGNLLFPDFA